MHSQPCLAGEADQNPFGEEPAAAPAVPALTTEPVLPPDYDTAALRVQSSRGAIVVEASGESEKMKQKRAARASQRAGQASETSLTPPGAEGRGLSAVDSMSSVLSIRIPSGIPPPPTSPHPEGAMGMTTLKAIGDKELAELKKTLTKTTWRLEEVNAELKVLKKTVNGLNIDKRELEAEVARLEAKGCCVIS